MFNAKSYNKIIFGFLIFFLFYNFLVWNFFVKDLIDPPKKFVAGELARLSYKSEFNVLKSTKITLPKKHIELSDYKNQKIDVLTIGDSFSNASASGTNPYYQDYLASYKNLAVLNIPLILDVENKSVLDVLIPLINNGFIDKLKPKYIILETVERSIGTYLAKDFDFSKNYEDHGNSFNTSNNAKEGKENFLKFINEANFRFLMFKIGYLFSDRPFNSSVYFADISQPLFSGKNPSKILFYDLDITYIKYNNKDRLNKVNNNLNKVAEILNKKNIKLYFIAVPDKFDLYYKYIKSNKYPKPRFFDDFNTLPKQYTYINGKEILEKELQNGKKDVYWQDDTHWSNIGMNALVKNFVKY